MSSNRPVTFVVIESVKLSSWSSRLATVIESIPFVDVGQAVPDIDQRKNGSLSNPANQFYSSDTDRPCREISPTAAALRL